MGVQETLKKLQKAVDESMIASARELKELTALAIKQDVYDYYDRIRSNVDNPYDRTHTLIDGVDVRYDGEGRMAIYNNNSYGGGVNAHDVTVWLATGKNKWRNSQIYQKGRDERIRDYRKTVKQWIEEDQNNEFNKKFQVNLSKYGIKMKKR